MIHSDGSARYYKKKWVGGYAFTLEYKNKTIYQQSGNFLPGNNNLCELLAAIKGIDYVVNHYDVEDAGGICLLTDSEYVLNGMSGKNKVKTNLPAWKYLRKLMGQYRIKSKHVASHKEQGNKHVDHLAKHKVRQYVLAHPF